MRPYGDDFVRDSNVTRLSLLSRLRDPSDEQSWREFSEQYGELILRYCRRRGLAHADSEDVRQIVLVALARAIRSDEGAEPVFRYQPGRGRFRDYLGATVRHAISRYMSRHARHAAGLSIQGTEAASQGTDADPLWEREWMDQHFRLAMATIERTFEPRSVAMFSEMLAGVESTVIAVEYSTTPDAVRKIKQRILARLKELVAEQIRAEDESDA
jgi:RNA polymerase sigma factor (sigma-70 family)